MPRICVERPNGAVAFSKREFALLKQLGDGEGAFDDQELAALARYGDKSKLDALTGDVSFEEFAEAFRKQVTEPELEGEGDCIGWATTGPGEPLRPWRFSRREPGPDDVVLQVTFCGICHSDIHQVRNEWGNSMYPMVPGHEVLGVVVATGDAVTRFHVGDFGAVGCMVDSCLSCSNCEGGAEQYCNGGGAVMTYNSKDKENNPTFGGYSSHIVCKEHFVLCIERAMHEAATAPLLCAGITTYEPMKVFGVDKEGQKVGVVGLGGLGHMAVKFAKAFGQHCTVISRSYAKKDMAMLELGADAFIAMNDDAAVSASSGQFDALIDTVSGNHDINALLQMLKLDGQLIFVGAPAAPYKIDAWKLHAARRSVKGSFIGGIARTQEMLDFCKEKDIRCDVEVIDISEVNTAFRRLEAGDVKFRFVIDNLRGCVTG